MTEIEGEVHSSQPHDSAIKQVTGRAQYLDDMALPSNTLHAYLGLAEFTAGTITALDLSAVRATPGVVGVLGAEDIPGSNDVSPTGLRDDPIFASEIEFWGQPIFAVVATSREIAREAARCAKVSYEAKPFALDIEEARKSGGKHVTPNATMQRGHVDEALRKAERRIKGELFMGGQDHFYLEGQIAVAIPGEDDEISLYSSAQFPAEVQHMVAHCLGVPSNAITVIVRRMGGGFGGKETQSNIFACVAALAARKFGHAVKIRPDRDDDMIMTGKRHDFLVEYDVGYDDGGKITAFDARFAARCGFSADLSGPITDRALFHADNCYFYPHVRLVSDPLKTNTVSNTAFRGFGGPQGMLGAEKVMQEIAYALGRDPLDVRKANFYSDERGTLTPYHQEVEDNIIARLVSELEESSCYAARRDEILVYNQQNDLTKKGIALTPVKFGISFTATWYNQAGALVHIYKDGSIHLNHGGTEMGQGLNTKVAQVLASEFEVDISCIKITATHTGKVPNASATAASSGTDLNGMAVQDAARQIKVRLADYAAQKYGIKPDELCFKDNKVICGNHILSFEDFIANAYMERVQLSAAGFYKTPKIHWDRASGRGRPFYYYAYGASVSEVSIDALTGEYSIDRVDILHDVGRSLNPALDIGQIEGGFIQGMGWLTTEELWWDDKGRLRTHAPSTYKIPLASDCPEVFNVTLADWSQNREMTIRRSKAVGEPPFMLAMSVWEALGMACASFADYKHCPQLDAPATPERVLMEVERMKGLLSS